MEKQFHAWAVPNPSLSVPPLVTLKSVGRHVPLQLLISPTQRGTSDPQLGTPVQLLGNSTWQKRNVFRHLDVVRWLEVQTKNQNKEERGFKWLWTWNGCWWFASWMCSRQIKISEEFFQHLVESMPRRIKAVLKAKRGPTQYSQGVPNKVASECMSFMWTQFIVLCFYLWNTASVCQETGKCESVSTSE